MPDSQFARHALGDAADHSSAGSQPQGWTPTPAEEFATDLAASHPHYRITSLLNHGGMGAVYLSTDSRPGSATPQIAIKALRHDALDDPAYVSRFQREIAILQKLKHPGIVPILDHGQTSHGIPFFVMPRLHGRTLHEALHGPRLPESHSLEIMARLCASVVAAHEKHIVHRDLKPQNIMLVSDPTSTSGREKVIVLDYGIARSRHTQPVTVPTKVPGTFGYIAPEVLRGEEASYPADIFALGFICHQLLTGNDAAVPFDARLEPIVAKAMHQFPSKRYQTAMEFAEALQQTVPAGQPPKRSEENGPAVLPRITSDNAPAKIIRPVAFASVIVALAAMAWHKYAPDQQTALSPSKEVSATSGAKKNVASFAPSSTNVDMIEPVDVAKLTRDLEGKYQEENRSLINAAIQEFLDSNKSATPPTWPNPVGLYFGLDADVKYRDDENFQDVFHPNGVYMPLGITNEAFSWAYQQLGRLIVVAGKHTESPGVTLRYLIFERHTSRLVELKEDGGREILEKLPQESYLRARGPSHMRYAGDRQPVAPSGWYKANTQATETTDWKEVMDGSPDYFFGANAEAHRRVNFEDKPTQITKLSWIQQGQVVLLGSKFYWIEKLPDGLGNSSRLWSESGSLLEPITAR